jgi:hypothetical protein
MLSFRAPASIFNRFAFSRCDPTITGLNGAGPADAVEAIFFRENISLLPNFNQYESSRVGGVLKIDAVGDTSPPGQGSGWLTSRQSSPAFGVAADDSSTLVIYRYTLVLDGTPGVRQIDAAFTTANNVPVTGIWGPGSSSYPVGYIVPTDVYPAQVNIVVPSPSPLAFLLATTTFAMRPRRRT